MLQNRVRELRKLRGMTLKALADKIGDGAHLSTIQKIEKGRMALSAVWMQKLATALEVPLSEIFEDTGNSRPGDQKIPLVYLSKRAKLEDAWIGDLINVNIYGEDVYAVEKDMFFGFIKTTLFRSFVCIDASSKLLFEDWPYAYYADDSWPFLGVYKSDPPRFEPYPGCEHSLNLYFGVSDISVIGEVRWEVSTMWRPPERDLPEVLKREVDNLADTAN
ncbi:helix-turn-helix domain-containing protein [Sphingomonas montana]|uniref:helix-turn-helix domain-containing protein n=1 Tax=Sphingomonas montana TaxID=1843236 RepID=UPI0009F92F46|nr:helix-turn-helix transcriptional regulator [Sphingomonas montana]